MTDTPVQRFYRLQAPIYNLTRWPFLRGRKTAIAWLDIQPDSLVLEIGCGTGANFKPIIARLDVDSGRLIGVDFSPAMLRRAGSRITRNRWQNVQLIAAEGAVLPLHASFDCILFSYSLAMMPDWADALDRAVERLAPGGRLVVLEFGRFERWGPLGALIRRYLRLNHVDTDRPILQRLATFFNRVQTRHWLGGYNFVAVGLR
ncbi:MAG: methyltransferase domain-containing protein [Phycisphaerae bacterium]